MNFLGTRQLIETALPFMREGSAIACISSVAGMGWPQSLSVLKELLATESIEQGRKWCEEHCDAIGDGYAFSKQALTAYVLREAATLGSAGIRINALCPGMTETPMMPDFEKTVGAELAALPCPLGRRARAEEQAHALLFLNHPNATYLTGCEFFNDGGSSAALKMGAAEAALARRRG